MIRYTVHFSGRVQGVGFRATVATLAEGFEAAGTVENLPDGRVRLVVEGTPQQLDALLEAINTRMSRYIRSTHIDRSPANGAFGAPTPGGVTIKTF